MDWGKFLIHPWQLWLDHIWWPFDNYKLILAGEMYLQLSLVTVWNAVYDMYFDWFLRSDLFNDMDFYWFLWWLLVIEYIFNEMYSMTFIDRIHIYMIKCILWHIFVTIMRLSVIAGVWNSALAEIRTGAVWQE